MNTIIPNMRGVPPLDMELVLNMGKKMLEDKNLSDDTQRQMGNMLNTIAIQKQAEEAYKKKRKDAERARFFMIEGYSFYNAPLIDFIGEQFDNLVNLYYDSKAFDDKELKNMLNLIWRLLSDEHVRYDDTAVDRKFYEAYRMYCLDYIRQNYKLLVARLTNIYRKSGERRCRMAAIFTALNAIATMSDTAKDMFGDSIRRYYNTKVDVESFSMENVRGMFDFIIKKLQLRFLTKLKPEVDRYLEEFYTDIYVNPVVSYALDHTKENFGKETYDARLHAIEIFGDKIFQ